MNLCILLGKIISDIEFKFIINSKNKSIVEFKIETLDNNIIKVYGYNEIADKELVNQEQVYGKVLLKINGIGKAIQYIQNVRGLINIAIFIVIIFMLVSIRDNQKNNRKIKRKKYEIKKMRDNYHL